VTHSADGDTWSGARVTAYRQALPDLHKEVDLLLSGGDHVVMRSTNMGTHLGELDHPDLGPAPPTGREVRWTCVDIYRFEHGRIVESWTQQDVVGALRQFGLMPKSTPTYI
jgi:predicted ester cyclase